MKTLCLAFVLLLSNFLQAAMPGDVDQSFRTQVGVGEGNPVAVGRQKDGKWIIAGSFGSVQGVTRRGIARLMSNGLLDLSFDTGWTADTGATVTAAAILPDGKILVAGSFTSFAGRNCHYLTRLLSDGRLDVTFNRSAGANNSITAMAVTPQGKIYISGNFTQVAGVARPGLALLNANGTLDLSFSPGVGPNSRADAILALPDGKIMIVGNFTQYNGTARPRVARVLATGALDATFNPGAGADNVVYCIAAQADGKFLLGGAFSNFAGAAHQRMTRLLPNGTVDPAFDPGTGVSGPAAGITCLEVLKDGKIYIGGSMTAYQGIPRVGVARLQANGSLDATFADGSLSDSGSVRDIEVLPNGRLVAVGSFAEGGGVAQISSSGVLDKAFSPGSNSDQIMTAAPLADGSVILGGFFRSYPGSNRRFLVKLRKDGALDLTWNATGTGPNDSIHNLAVQSDGKVILVGPLTSYNGVNVGGICRLNANGSLDTSFSAGGPAFAGGYPSQVRLQPDGRLLVAGSFTQYNGVARAGLVRLLSNRALDTSFDPGTGTNGVIHDLVLNAAGRIYIVGSFTSYQGTARSGVARLLSSGALDPSFNPGSGFADGFSVQIVSAALDGSQRLLVCGDFNAYDGTPVASMVRLNANGTLDASFASGLNYRPNHIVVQPDQRILITGEFSEWNAESARGLMRLYADGSRDRTFSPGPGWGAGSRIHLMPNGLAYLIGNFESYNGHPANEIARIHTVFSPDKMSFAGIVDAVGSNDPNLLRLTGSFTLTTSTNGLYSGKMVIRGETISMTGALDMAGRSSIHARRKDGGLLYLDLVLSRSEAGGSELRGQLRDAQGLQLAIEARAPFFTARRRAHHEAGVYHVAMGIPGETAYQDGVNPSAYSYLTCTVDTLGRATVVGRLSDGSPVTQSSLMAEVGTVLLHQPLYGGQGALNGRLIVDAYAESDEFRGQVYAALGWLRPANVPGGLYPAGFSTNLYNIESSGLAPDLNRLLPATTTGAAVPVQVNLAGGHYTVAGLTSNVQINGQGASAPVVGGVLPGLKVTVNRAKGTFTGSWIPSGTTKPVPFQGLVVGANRGLGHALMTEAGSTRIVRVSLTRL